MTTPTSKLYPSAPLENNESEQRLQKKLRDVKSFSTSNINIEGLITYFNDKNIKWKNKYKSYETPTSILESVDTNVNTGATTTSVTLSFTGVDLIVVPISAAIACALSLANKVIQKIIINNYNNSEKQIEKGQESIKSFDKF